MKKLFTYWAVSTFLFLSPQLYGQSSFALNIHSQPEWGPAGYDYAAYYYLPDVEMYYNVPQKKYIYNERGRWVSVSALPSWHRNYDIDKAYKVVLNEPEPYLSFDKHKVKYARYKNCYGQQRLLKENKGKHNNNSASIHKGNPGKNQH